MSRCPTVPLSTGHGRTHHRPIGVNFRHCTTQRVLTVIERNRCPLQESLPVDIPRQESPSDSRRMSVILLMSSRILVLPTRKGFYLNKPRRILPYGVDLQASGNHLLPLEWPSTRSRVQDIGGGAAARKILPYSKLTFFLHSARLSTV